MIKSTDSERSAISAAIASAFVDVACPGQDRIVGIGYPYDPDNEQSYTDSEAERVRIFFAGRDWHEMTGNLGNRVEVQDAFIFFTPVASRYYLPAYMEAALLDWRANIVATEAVLRSLLNPSKRPFLDAAPLAVRAEIQQKWEMFMDSLTEGQLHAIGRFLQYLMRLARKNLGDDIEAIYRGNGRLLYPP